MSLSTNSSSRHPLLQKQSIDVMTGFENHNKRHVLPVASRFLGMSSAMSEWPQPQPRDSQLACSSTSPIDEILKLHQPNWRCHPLSQAQLMPASSSRISQESTALPTPTPTMHWSKRVTMIQYLPFPPFVSLIQAFSMNTAMPLLQLTHQENPHWLP